MRVPEVSALIVCAMVAVTGPLLADDFNPPSWRGNDTSLTAEWEILSDTNPLPPDGPLTSMSGTSGIYTTELETWDTSWQTGDGDGELIWSARNSFKITMDNFADSSDEMLIWLQMTGAWTAAPEIVIVRGYGVDEGWVFGDETAPLASGASSTQAWWLYSLAPSTDKVEVWGDCLAGTTLDQVVMDITPEPGTLGLLLLGGLGVLIRRRRAA